MDESRLGLHTIRRRRITVRGIQPIGIYQHAYSNFYLYGTIAPPTGEAYFLGLPTLSAAHFQLFLDHFAMAHPHTLNVLLVDNSRTHTAAALRIPPNIKLLFQHRMPRNSTRRNASGVRSRTPWLGAAADLASLRAVQMVDAWTASLLPVLDSLPIHH